MVRKNVTEEAVATSNENEHDILDSDRDNSEWSARDVTIMADVIQSRYLTSTQAAEALGIKNAHFRTMVRRGSPGTELLHPIKFAGNVELFLDDDVEQFRLAREQAKANRATKKATKKSRRVNTLNLNLLHVLAQQLNIDGQSKMSKTDLKNAVQEAIADAVEGDFAIDNYDTFSLVSLVNEIVMVRDGKSDMTPVVPAPVTSNELEDDVDANILPADNNTFNVDDLLIEAA